MPTVTRADLRERIYDRLDGNFYFYRDTEVHRAINDAIRALNLFTGFIQQTTTHGSFTTANTHIYDMPSGYLFPTRLSFAGRVLDKTSLTNLSSAFPEWLKETTANTGIPVSRWCPIGLNKFAVHPADSVGSNTIKFSGVAEPTALTVDTSTIQIPNEFSEMIVDLASHYLQLKEGGLIFAQASLLYQGFLSRMKELKRYTTAKNPSYYVSVQSPE